MEYLVVPPYGKQVLIGNWADRRYATEGKSNGILPGLERSEHCELHRSLNQDTYMDVAYKNEYAERSFFEKRVARARNFKADKISNVSYCDAKELNNNFTTTNTLLYDLLPKLRQSLHINSTLPKSGLPEPQPDLDMLQSFGNLTKTHNYMATLKRRVMHDQLERMQTTYGSAYNRSRDTTLRHKKTKQGI